jgi:ketosteroid isomerase-like protein
MYAASSDDFGGDISLSGGVMQLKAIVVSGLAFSVLACKAESVKTPAGNATANSAAEAELMQVSRNWAKAAASGNLDSTLAYWSDDAVVLQPGDPAYVGKAAIKGMVEGAMKIPRFSITWAPERASISQSGDMGYLIEHNRVTFADSAGKVHTQYGKGVTVWKKDANGVWKNVVDIFNPGPTEMTLPNG